MRKIVLDTNVFVSGFLWNGNEAILIKKIEQKLAQCFITEEIPAEIENVVRRDKFSKAFLLAHSSPDEMIAKIRNQCKKGIENSLKLFPENLPAFPQILSFFLAQFY